MYTPRPMWVACVYTRRGEPNPGVGIHWLGPLEFQIPEEDVIALAVDGDVDRAVIFRVDVDGAAVPVGAVRSAEGNPAGHFRDPRQLASDLSICRAAALVGAYRCFECFKESMSHA